MGTLATASSAFYQPLDTILGSTASVRVLRTLASHGGWLTANSISQRASLNRAGVGRVLDTLVLAGIVERIGQGRSLLYRFGEHHPLAGALSQMFQAERNRVDGLIAEVRSIAAELTPTPVAVWQFGSTTRREDRHDSDFDIAVVWPDDDIQRHTEDFAQRMETAGQRWAIVPSVVDFAVADIMEASSQNRPFWRNLMRDYRLLFGQRPDEIARAQR
jgi:predicted nucleotidyltransferase